MDNQEFLTKMKVKCPKLLREINYLECDVGWHLLLETLFLTIEAEIDHIGSTNPELAEQLYAVQIKQKFGQLRHYMSYSHPVIDGVIRMAENMSLRTCEVCGGVALGTRSINRWIVVQCDKCSERDTTTE